MQCRNAEIEKAKTGRQFVVTRHGFRGGGGAGCTRDNCNHVCSNGEDAPAHNNNRNNVSCSVMRRGGNNGSFSHARLIVGHIVCFTCVYPATNVSIRRCSGSTEVETMLVLFQCTIVNET